MRYLAMLALASIASGLSGCGDDHSKASTANGAGGKATGAAAAPNAPGPGGGRRAVPFPVEVAPVDVRAVEYRVVAVGSVEAFETVQVTARVQGVVDGVRFSEGDRVQAGATLVEIEPERFRLAVEAARATLEKADAAQAEAEAGLQRREGATTRNPGIIPAEEIETWRTRVRTATAERLQASTALQQAELDQHDAYVRAPVGGTIQTRSVQTGAFVQPGTTLATLMRRDPLLLRFSIPEQDAARVHAGMRATFRVRDNGRDYESRITHVAAGADLATRMVAVTAHVTVPEDGAPRPGAFAEVTIPVGGSSRAPVVPETAVRPSERGFIAYVIRNGKAEERVLTLGMRTDDGRVEVREGLAPAESLVVRGAEALRQGAAVRVVAAMPESDAGRPSGDSGPPGGVAPNPASGRDSSAARSGTAPGRTPGAG